MYRKFNRKKKRIITMVWLYVIIYFVLSILISIFIGNFLDKLMRGKFLAAINLVIPDYTPILGKKISSDPYVNSVLNDVRVKNDIEKIKNAIAKFLSLIFSLIFVFFISSLYFSDRKETDSEKLDVKEKILPKNLEEGAEQLFVQFGPFGDLFNGSLTPLLTFATFTGLLITIIMQHMQMRATLAELQMSRIEMADSTDALQAQVKNSQAQKFDSNFYSMLQLHMDLAEKLKTNTSVLSEEFKEINSKSSSWSEFRKPDELRSFFLINYQLLKFIKKNEYDETISSGEAKQYANIVRAILNDDLYGLIFINCLNHRFDKYKKLIEHYSFLEHFVFSKFNDIDVLNKIKKYEMSVFGDSQNLFNFLKNSNSNMLVFIGQDILRLNSRIYTELNDDFIRLISYLGSEKWKNFNKRIELLKRFDSRIKEIKISLKLNEFLEDGDASYFLLNKDDYVLLCMINFDFIRYLNIALSISSILNEFDDKYKYIEREMSDIETKFLIADCYLMSNINNEI